MKFDIFIPARLGSSRLQNKLLLELNNYKIIEHAILRSYLSKKFRHVSIVTPDKKKINQRIKKIQNVIFLKNKFKHSSGLSRVFEFINHFKSRYFFVLFGDEALIDPKHIKKFVNTVIKDKKNNAWNAVTNLNKNEKKKETCVKVDLDKKNYITNFVRLEDSKKKQVKSVGLFAFKKSKKIEFNNLKIKKKYKKLKIEQFMFLNNNIKLQLQCEE